MNQHSSSAASTTIRAFVKRQLPGFLLDVGFETNQGMVAIVGPSGSGKTLTLKAIAGLLEPDCGEVSIGNRVLFQCDDGSKPAINMPARGRGIGFVFQQYALFPHMTVAANIAYGLNGMTRYEREDRIQQMLQLTRLERHAGKRPSSLSGGEQQRAALARALAPKPSLLLLDEPLSALDMPLRKALGTELRRLHESTNTPMLMVTHDPEEAARITDAIVHLQDGRTVES